MAHGKCCPSPFVVSAAVTVTEVAVEDTEERPVDPVHDDDNLVSVVAGRVVVH